MTDDIVKATKVMVDEQKVLVGVPEGMEERALNLAGDIRAGLIRVNAAIDAKDADKVSIRTGDTLANVAQLELIQAPGLAFSIPRDLLSYPRLTGRATVELTFGRGGDMAFVGKEGGGGKPQGSIRMEVDGYSAPLTSGNFVANVASGAYDGSQLAIGGETVSVASSKLPSKVLPMEMLALGQYEPIYRSPLDVQNGELPVLPLSIYGAVAMAHPGADAPDGTSSANEFFLYKFDKASSGLAGLSFEEGNFSVFGYITGGAEYIPQLQAGDTILNARLISGGERLVVPESSPPQ
jgi:cyclophilin family peptidyl-prolyl cis-trans isomerase